MDKRSGTCLRLSEELTKPSKWSRSTRRRKTLKNSPISSSILHLLKSQKIRSRSSLSSPTGFSRPKKE